MMPGASRSCLVESRRRNQFGSRTKPEPSTPSKRKLEECTADMDGQLSPEKVAPLSNVATLAKRKHLEMIETEMHKAEDRQLSPEKAAPGLDIGALLIVATSAKRKHYKIIETETHKSEEHMAYPTRTSLDKAARGPEALPPLIGAISVKRKHQAVAPDADIKEGSLSCKFSLKDEMQCVKRRHPEKLFELTWPASQEGHHIFFDTTMNESTATLPVWCDILKPTPVLALTPLNLETERLDFDVEAVCTNTWGFLTLEGVDEFQGL